MNNERLAGIYVIYDKVAKGIQGGLYIHKHDAAAVRFFTDVASDKQTIVGKHVPDFELVQLGFITHNNELVPQYKKIMDGNIWAAAMTTDEVT